MNRRIYMKIHPVSQVYRNTLFPVVDPERFFDTP